MRNLELRPLIFLLIGKKKGYLKSGIDDGASYDIFNPEKQQLTLRAFGQQETTRQILTLIFGVMPIPAINGQQKTWGDSHTFGIPSYVDGERQEAALYFADWINSHAVTWAKAGHVPAKKTVTESEEYLNLPYRSDYAKVVDQVVYYPSNEKLWSANDIAAKLINTAFIGDMTSQEALDLAKEEIEAIME